MICKVIHSSLAVCVFVDQINDFFSTAIEFIFNVEDFDLCDSVKSTTYSDCSCSSAGSDQNHLHSFEINAFFFQSLPVSHTVSVVAFKLSGNLSVFITHVYNCVDRTT